ncbi:MAG: DUF433 domain-containing protein [Bacteroidia bacterium]|nr:DUF433 domain-containing protein [Bacteroidia bacterium]
MEVLTRITLNPEVCNGRPSIRNQQVSVSMLLEMMAEGQTPDQIMSNFPFLEKEDFQACLRYAARLTNF